MAERRVRKLGDGKAVLVHDNDGLRKICRCPRRSWAKCAHPWHFNYAWAGEHYRFSLNRQLQRRVLSKRDARTEANRLRVAIEAGEFRPEKGPQPAATTIEGLGVEYFKT